MKNKIKRGILGSGFIIASMLLGSYSLYGEQHKGLIKVMSFKEGNTNATSQYKIHQKLKTCFNEKQGEFHIVELINSFNGKDQPFYSIEEKLRHLAGILKAKIPQNITNIYLIFNKMITILGNGNSTGKYETEDKLNIDDLQVQIYQTLNECLNVDVYFLDVTDGFFAFPNFFSKLRFVKADGRPHVQVLADCSGRFTRDDKIVCDKLESIFGVTNAPKLIEVNSGQSGYDTISGYDTTLLCKDKDSSKKILFLIGDQRNKKLYMLLRKESDQFSSFEKKHAQTLNRRWLKYALGVAGLGVTSYILYKLFSKHKIQNSSDGSLELCQQAWTDLSNRTDNYTREVSSNLKEFGLANQHVINPHLAKQNRQMIGQCDHSLMEVKSNLAEIRSMLQHVDGTPPPSVTSPLLQEWLSGMNKLENDVKMMGNMNLEGHGENLEVLNKVDFIEHVSKIQDECNALEKSTPLPTPAPTPLSQKMIIESTPTPTPPSQETVIKPTPAPLLTPAPTPPSQKMVIESTPAPTPPSQKTVIKSTPAPAPEESSCGEGQKCSAAYRYLNNLGKKKGVPQKIEKFKESVANGWDSFSNKFFGEKKEE